MAENEGIKDDGSLPEDEDDDLFDGDSHLSDGNHPESEYYKGTLPTKEDEENLSLINAESFVEVVPEGAITVASC